MSDLPKGIEKRGDNTYRITVTKGYVNGKQQRIRKTIRLASGMTEKAQIAEAEKERAKLLASADRGEVTNAPVMTVEAFAREWFENGVCTKGNSPVTVAYYRRALNDHILPHSLGTPLSVQRWISMRT